MLKLNNISKSFSVSEKVAPVLNGVSLEIKGGEFLAIIGPSGSGKSTLLRIIAGLEKQTSGEVIWQQDPNLAFVFQNFALFPYLTVFENIEFGLKMKKVPSAARKKVVGELVREVGLEGFEDKHPKELSGGMKQRVGLARALAVSPNVILMDEPFSALDEFTADTLRLLFLKIWKDRGLSVIMVTHLIKEAIFMADKIVVMSSRPGTILEIIDDNLKRPRDVRGKEFFRMEDYLNSKIQRKLI